MSETLGARAQTIFHDWIQSESLRKHCYAVADSMKHFAQLRGENADLWEAVVAAAPASEAMVCGERRLTFREADERVLGSRMSYWTAIVRAVVTLVPPAVTTSGTAGPVGAPSGIRTLTWFTPGSPGARPV